MSSQRSSPELIKISWSKQNLQLVEQKKRLKIKTGYVIDSPVPVANGS